MVKIIEIGRVSIYLLFPEFLEEGFEFLFRNVERDFSEDVVGWWGKEIVGGGKDIIIINNDNNIVDVIWKNAKFIFVISDYKYKWNL